MYSTIKGKIKTILENITGVKVVFTDERAEITGYPAIVLTGFEYEDKWEDTITNIREYTFRFSVLQEMKRTSETDAEAIVDALTDRILDAFGKDFTLTGSAIGCWIRGANGWVNRSVECRVMDFRLLVKAVASIT